MRRFQAEAEGIVAGADGNLWFTEYGTGNIGRITPAGNVTEFAGAANRPIFIVAGPDGNLWFTEYNGIGCITPGGVVTNFPVPTSDTYPNGIAVGPDGNIWFTEMGNNSIGRIAP